MNRAALLFPAISALALLPAIGAQAATSCSDELHQLAQTYHLSLSPSATAQAGNSAEQGGGASSPKSDTTSQLDKIQGLLSQRQETTQGASGQSAQGAGRSSAAPSMPNNTAEAPATTESRGMAAGPDSLQSSGGTLPPATNSGAHDQQHSGAAGADQLGPVDRAKAEGMLSEAQAADAQGKGDQCLKFLRAAQGMLKGRQ
ncbi:MAG TPA: hypothetical protein VJ747_19190 [Stellaceae bacterium]|nr:hypothetical protein [Stellaceae bacterium]